MTLFESCWLGLIQGLTEFLPVSSDGHLVLAETFLQFKASDLLSFDLLLHLATLLSVTVYYRKPLIELYQAGLPPYSLKQSSPSINAQRKLLAAIAISTFVTCVIGFLFKDPFEETRDNLGLVGLFFIITGALLAATRWSSPKPFSPQQDAEKGFYPINPWAFAVLMGLMQGLAILPGVSRSGMTVCTALLLGAGRAEAVEYSFLLSVPVILIAAAYQLLFSDSPLGSIPFLSGLVGFVTAMVSGFLFLSLLVWIVKKGQLYRFSFYVIPLGLLVMGYYFLH